MPESRLLMAEIGKRTGKRKSKRICLPLVNDGKRKNQMINNNTDLIDTQKVNG